MSTRRRLFLMGLVTVVLLAAIAYGGASWFFTSIVVARPTQTLAESAAQIGLEPADYGLPIPEAVTFSNDGVTLNGWLFANEMDGDCGVVILHGYTGTRYSGLPYAPLFWERGCDLLLYDARGHGDSDGRFHTYGYFEKEDAQVAVALLMAETGLAEDDIGLVGNSYGAATALQTAPLLPELAFVIADSAYADLERILAYQARAQYGEVVTTLLPGVKFLSRVRADLDVEAVSPETAVADAAMPIMLTHSLQDEYTLPQHSEAIYARSNPTRTMIFLNDWGSPHGGDIVNEPELFAENVDLFLAAFVPEFGLDPAE